MELSLIRELLSAGASLTFTARQVTGGFTLAIKTPSEERMLSAQRGHARVFKKLDTIASTLEELGVREFCVVLNG